MGQLYTCEVCNHNACHPLLLWLLLSTTKSWYLQLNKKEKSKALHAEAARGVMVVEDDGGREVAW